MQYYSHKLANVAMLKGYITESLHNASCWAGCNFRHEPREVCATAVSLFGSSNTSNMQACVMLMLIPSSLKTSTVQRPGHKRTDGRNLEFDLKIFVCRNERATHVMCYDQLDVAVSSVICLYLAFGLDQYSQSYLCSHPAAVVVSTLPEMQQS